jgi:hypothetical protein
MLSPTVMKEVLIKYKNLLPLLVLAGFCLYTILDILINSEVHYKGEIYHRTFSAQQYAAFLLLGIDVSVFFTKRSWYTYFLITTLLLGLLNAINFTPTLYTVTLFSPKIAFQPLSAATGIFTFFLNFNRFKNGPLSISQEVVKQIEREQEKNLAEEVDRFKSKFTNKPHEELAELLLDKRFSKAAVEAARQLLDERK